VKLLAIDTSSNACSVALGIDGSTEEDHVVEPREHTRILMPMITRRLDAAGLAPSDLDAVVLGNGPGSFIGMRIGAAVAQGICHAAGIRLIPVSSMAAVAAEALAGTDADRVVVTQDARMNEVYVGEFRRGDSDLPVAEDREFIAPVGPLPVSGKPCLAAGGGWRRFPALLEANAEPVLGVSEVAVPRARFLLAIAEGMRPAAIAPVELTPAYLRQKVANSPPDER